MDEQFIAGRELSRKLARIVEPALREMMPSTPLALAFFGPGSDVLGYDTARSMDHDWGPRLAIVVPESSREDVAGKVDEAVDRLLPATVSGFPTRFSYHPDGTLFADAKGKIHRLQVTSVPQTLREAAGIDSLDGLTSAVWLSTPMQSLLEITSGEVFTDDDGSFTALRKALAFYPEDILRYQLSALWMRVGQVQPFIGRTGEVGDDTGSAAITASIARDLMRIALLQSGRYPPYAKWLGTASARTPVGEEMEPHLMRALSASAWQEREDGINRAGCIAISHLNRLELISRMPDRPAQFHTRPFHVLPAEEIARALHASLAGTLLATLPPFMGGIDAVTDSTDALKAVKFRDAFRRMIESSLR